ncbi:hypothetical protein CERSUDRAFT_143953 [Gelatoporia subvermispora B]|uniref:Nuclear condensin complex subunit 3 C-terminal domain-containing protein n=1 Tax=Ceriporiopsis subvermispora (strain B) TaxID=914234 RepID=M2Q5S8_CERS8|nr:hypothetical protein CERSUDRAFT_143953 [Gelatoporia subvermispora B]
MPQKSSAVLETLEETVPAIFDQAQLSLANHRKNCVALHKIHTQAAAVCRPAKDGTKLRLVGEKAFSNVFIDMLSRVLVVKKGNQAADRVIRFMGAYVKYALEKATSKTEAQDDEDETPASRFALRLLSWTLQGFEAKDKTVRYRCITIIEELLSHFTQVDEDTFSQLLYVLEERIRDKEPSIRAHAVCAFAKLLGGEDPDQLPDDEPSILDILLHTLCYDPAAEVRRAALLHIPLTPSSLSAVLTRTRDVDTLIRKITFALLRPPSPSSSSAPKKSAPAPPLTHPRQLVLEQREHAVRDGLGDREDVVRVVAGQMIGAWFDVVREETGGKVMPGLEEFLQLFDAVVPDGLGVAVDALKCLFVTRSDVLRGVKFDDVYFDELTPERALLARVFHAYCLDNKENTRLEDANIPVVTAMAFRIQNACNLLLDAIEGLEDTGMVDSEDGDRAEEALGKLEEAVVERAFIVAELLRLGARCDYSDEIGRRKVFAVVREMLAHEFLPESLIDPCMDVLAETAPDERELIRVVVEIVCTLRDDGESGTVEQSQLQTQASESFDITPSTSRNLSLRRAKQPHQMTPEERERADVVDVRCLAICIAMLSRVNGNFDENSTLEGVLTDLVLPAVKRTGMSLRERGLVALGLCCLIAKNMAIGSFQLFLNQIQCAPEDLKIKVLQIVFDMLMVYEQDLLRRSDELAERIIAFLLQILEVDDSQAVQAVLCVGISKLMLNGRVKDKRVLAALVLAYVSPATADNQELRQCLAYALPAYCYSSPVNQDRMRSIFLTAYRLVTEVHSELKEGQEMISPQHFGLLFVDWTDPQKAAQPDRTDDGCDDIHVDFAIDLYVELYSPITTVSDKRTLSQLLAKLHLSTSPEPIKLLMLSTLLSNLPDEVLKDAALPKVLERFKKRFMKQYAKQLEGLDVDRLVQNPRFKELCTSVGLGPDSEDEQESRLKPAKGGHSVSALLESNASKRARSSSGSSSSEDDRNTEVSPELSVRSTSRSPIVKKRRRSIAR